MSAQENKKITPRETDFSAWYQDVIAAADLAEHGPVRGTMVIKPNGYAIWENVQRALDASFKALGVKNAYFPLLIPEKYLTREAEHVEGFAPEVAVVTHAGGSKLDEPLVIRPTSETIIYEVIKGWIHSHRDLPLLLNQWANVVRWEMRPRLFLRTTEFLWQEGHTAHATAEESEAFARKMLGIYETFARDYMAISGVPGQKSDSEKFAGAKTTFSLEAMMQDGKALQFSTSHDLGQNFAKAFGVEYTTTENASEFVHQTSWGLSTRSIGGLIMSHSDDKGLVLPPMMAPTKVIIVPIWKDEEGHALVVGKAAELTAMLKEQGVSCETDLRDLRPGEKYYDAERQGIPLRIEVGPRDVAAGTVVIVRRDTGEKTVVAENELATGKVGEMLTAMQNDLLERSRARREERTVNVDTWDEFTAALDAGKFVLAHWDGTKETEKAIKEETKATVRCIPFEGDTTPGVCVKTGKPSARRVLFARSY